MNFRSRLALFLVGTLIIVQLMTAFFGYFYLRRELISRGSQELRSAMAVFSSKLEFIEERAKDEVRVLSLDYALRSAIAQHDYDTEFSAVRNHGRRVGASRMMIVGLQGRTDVDTARPEDRNTRFPFGQMLSNAADNGEASAVVSVAGRVYLVVVVPVRAPTPIGFIAAFMPVDAVMLRRVGSITIGREAIALFARSSGGWIQAARSDASVREVSLPSDFTGNAQILKVAERRGSEYLDFIAPLRTTSGSPPVYALISDSLDQILAPYRALLWPMLGLVVFALIVAAVGAVLIVRHASRPIEALAVTARRISVGDYSPPEQFPHSDEIGHLAAALTAMTHAIAEREARLTRAVEETELARSEAVRASQAKSNFLANMSHELRTPLNAIVGFSQMLEQEVLGPLGARRYREYARDILGSGHHLLAQVERMLDMSQSEVGELALVQGLASPGALLLECIVQLKRDAEKADVAVVLRNDPSNLPVIACDAARLKIALSNLVHNAIKFTPPGGQVTITTAFDAESLSIVIEDTGVGIEPNMIGAIMKPFHRLRSALDGQHQGTGLGLPFAKMVVELHGGQLNIESSVGAGTRVFMHLPRAANDEERAA